jgi:hypothetical protein
MVQSSGSNPGLNTNYIFIYYFVILYCIIVLVLCIMLHCDLHNVYLILSDGFCIHVYVELWKAQEYE